MKKTLLLICIFFVCINAKANQIDEHFNQTPTGWTLNGIDTRVENGYLQLSRASRFGWVETTPIASPSSITIITNNTGTSNRSIEILYESGGQWISFFQYTVTSTRETVNVPVTALAGITGTFRLRIVNLGSNEYRIDQLTVGQNSLDPPTTPVPPPPPTTPVPPPPPTEPVPPPPTAPGPSPTVDVPVGFASVSGRGFTGPTTGGGNVLTSTNVFVVYGNQDFERLVRLLHDRIRAYRNRATFGTAQFAPLVVIFEEGRYPGMGSIANSGSVWSPSGGMMSIEEQGDITFIGRGNVVLNFGFNVKRSRNIIFRNLTFYAYIDDAINIGQPETHHVWVDHCTFGHPTTRPTNTGSPDSGVDVKDGASFVTISNSVFRNKHRCILIGHSDNHGATDRGNLKTTLYMNHFVNTGTRHPRVRFGEVHVLNNFYEGVTNYGIAAAYGANVLAEGNFFLNTIWPMYADRTESDFSAVYGNWPSQTGNMPATGLRQINNLYDDSGLTRVLTASNINTNMLNPGHRSIRFDELNPQQVFNPLTYYQYTPVNAALVPDLVRTSAGANRINFFGTIPTGSVNDIREEIALLVYPNPATDNFTIRTSTQGVLLITEITGRRIFTSSIVAGDNHFSVNQLNLLPGLYVITLMTEGQNVTSKLVIR